MTPLTVSANNAAVTYNGAPYANSPSGVTYSTAPNGNLMGALTYGGGAQEPTNAGSYSLGGLYSNQQGYIITYGGGTLTINPLASESWIGSAAGNWSTAANWSLGLVPDYGNVLAVTIPKGDAVTYDAAMAALGTTTLSSLSSGGKILMAAGELDTTGNFSTGGFVQSGGVLEVGGTLKIAASASGVQLGNITAGTLNVSAKGGAITELGGASVEVTGTSTLAADNGTSYYGITLANAGNEFTGAIAATGSTIDLESGTGNLTLGNTAATGTLTVTALGGVIKQAAGKSIDVTGLVTADASAITLDSSAALDAQVTSPGAVSLTAAGPLAVSGSIGANLTTVTTGTGSATSFGDATVGKKLIVTSTGEVSTLAGDALTVDGKGTTKPNKQVTVNGVNDVAIPVQ
jgi:hypothetical protein